MSSSFFLAPIPRKDSLSSSEGERRLWSVERVREARGERGREREGDSRESPSLRSEGIGEGRRVRRGQVEAAHGQLSLPKPPALPLLPPFFRPSPPPPFLSPLPLSLSLSLVFFKSKASAPAVATVLTKWERDEIKNKRRRDVCPFFPS